MAEGFLRSFDPRLEVFSAGVYPALHVSTRAIAVMKEAGIDISSHSPKSVDQFLSLSFDYVVTVCDSAHESCPIFPGKTKVVHISFDDPPRLAKETKTEKDALNIYRRVRDGIKAFVEKLPDNIRK